MNKLAALGASIALVICILAGIGIFLFPKVSAYISVACVVGAVGFVLWNTFYDIFDDTPSGDWY